MQTLRVPKSACHLYRAYDIRNFRRPPSEKFWNYFPHLLNFQQHNTCDQARANFISEKTSLGFNWPVINSIYSDIRFSGTSLRQRPFPYRYFVPFLSLQELRVPLHVSVTSNSEYILHHKCKLFCKLCYSPCMARGRSLCKVLPKWHSGKNKNSCNVVLTGWQNVLDWPLGWSLWVYLAVFS